MSTEQNIGVGFTGEPRVVCVCLYDTDNNWAREIRTKGVDLYFDTIDEAKETLRKALDHLDKLQMLRPALGEGQKGPMI